MTGTARTMTVIARDLLAALPPGARDRACYPFSGPVRTQWSYLPGSRPGISLAELGKTGRKAAHRLLATALSRHAFAQAVTIMAFEEVLDLDEHGRLGRHNRDSLGERVPGQGGGQQPVSGLAASLAEFGQADAGA